MKNLRKTRVVTYRRYGIPALILEGKWLTEKYRLVIGDLVDIDYQLKEIRLQKNSQLSRERQKRLIEIKEIQRQRVQELEHDTSTRKNENLVERSGEVSEG